MADVFIGDLTEHTAEAGTSFIEIETAALTSRKLSIANLFAATAMTTAALFSAATTISVGAATSVTTWTGRSYTFTGANSTNNTTLTVQNTSNAAAASHSILSIAIGGTTSTGDPQLRFTTPGGTNWYIGSDTNQSQPLMIGTGTAVGTNVHMTISPSTETKIAFGSSATFTSEKYSFLGSIDGSAGSDLFGVVIKPTLVEAASSTHGLVAGLYVNPTITAGAGNVTTAAGLAINTLTAQSGTTNAAALYLVGAPTGATNNYALFVDSGNSRFDGGIELQGALPSGTGIGSSGANGDLRLYANGSQFATMNTSGNWLLGTGDREITTSTSDAADSSALFISGGGAVSSTRGASVLLYGNEHTQVGLLRLGAGNSGNSAAVIRFDTAATERARVTFEGYFKASNDGTYIASTQSYHEFRSDNGSNYVLALSSKHATTPFGLSLTFSASSPDNNTQDAIAFSDSTTTRFRVWSDGDVVNHDGTYGTISDLRYKPSDTITVARSQRADVRLLAAAMINYETVFSPGRKLLGWGAQDVQQISPGVVHVSKWNGEDALFTDDMTILKKGFKALGEVIEIQDDHEESIADLLAWKAKAEAALAANGITVQ